MQEKTGEHNSHPPKEPRNILRGRNFLKELLGFAFLYAIFYLGFPYILKVLNGWAGWFYIFFYILFFMVFVIWVKGIKKMNLRPFLLSRPHQPEKGHRWFYVAYGIFWAGIVIFSIVLLFQEVIFLPTFNVQLILLFLHACVGAPIVEEIVFRGYLYSRAEAVWGRRRIYLTWNREEKNKLTGYSETKRIMTFEITYAALFTSIIFGIYHLSLIQSIITFIGGLLFCKARNEWGTTLIAPMIFHASWNFLMGFLPLLFDATIFLALEVNLIGYVLIALGVIFGGHYLASYNVRWLDQLQRIIVREKLKPFLKGLLIDGDITNQQSLQLENLVVELVVLVGRFIEKATPKSLLLYYMRSMGTDSPELLELAPSLLRNQFRRDITLNMLWKNTGSTEIDSAIDLWETECKPRTEQLMRILEEINNIYDSIKILAQFKESFAIKNIATDLTGVLDFMTGSDAFDNLTSFNELKKNLSEN